MTTENMLMKLGTSFTHTNESIIPKTIHFIWAGGSKLLPDTSIEIIKKWASQNPTFEIFLWIDSKTYPGGFEAIKTQYQELFDQTSPSIVIILKDIETENIVDEYIRYEIDKLRPNYGASSDLLRYKILYVYGGCYFDSDVEPTNINLSQTDIIFKSKLDKPILYVDCNSQGMGMIGNDAFICSKNNPLMKLIYDESIINYSYNAQFKLAAAYKGDDIEFIKSDTIYKTGPGCVRAVLSKDRVIQSQLKIPDNWGSFGEENATGLVFDTLDAQTLQETTKGVSRTWYRLADQKLSKIGVVSHQCRDLQFDGKRLTAVPADGNTTNWLKVPIKKFSSDNNKELLKVTLAAVINFEAEHCKIVRLNDHVLNTLETKVYVSSEEAIAVVKDLIPKNLYNIFVQLDSFKILTKEQVNNVLEEIYKEFKNNNIEILKGLCGETIIIPKEFDDFYNVFVLKETGDSATKYLESINEEETLKNETIKQIRYFNSLKKDTELLKIHIEFLEEKIKNAKVKEDLKNIRSNIENIQEMLEKFQEGLSGIIEFDNKYSKDKNPELEKTMNKIKSSLNKIIEVYSLLTERVKELTVSNTNTLNLNPNKS